MADTYLIAEIGTGHGGDLGKATELIRAARECGADCAKFQYVIADEIIHPRTGSVALPGGEVPLYERFKQVERDRSFYAELAAVCEAAEIDFLCSPFGADSAAALYEIGAPAFKIASPELNHLPLLDQIASYGRPVFLSTGVSRLADIELALARLGETPTTILHCITSYPAPEQEYNLSLIRSLSAVFGVPVGVSDHSTGSSLVPGLASALGACVIEKHFTLDRSGDGLDDPIALDRDAFTAMSATVRRVDAVLSLDPDEGTEKVIAAFKSEYGRQRIERILGDGVKRLAPSEEAAYPTTRRTIHAVTNLPAGHTIGTTDIALLRSEANLRPGLDPIWLDQVLGTVTATAIPAGEGVRFADLTRRQTA